MVRCGHTATFAGNESAGGNFTMRQCVHLYLELGELGLFLGSHSAPGILSVNFQFTLGISLNPLLQVFQVSQSHGSPRYSVGTITFTINK